MLLLTLGLVTLRQALHQGQALHKGRALNKGKKNLMGCLHQAVRMMKMKLRR